MDYGQLLNRSFSIAWRNRYLWPFGLFGGAGGGVPSFNFGYTGDFEETSSAAPLGPAPAGDLGIDPAILIAIIGGFVLFLVVLFCLSALSQGALAEAVAALERGEERRFGSAFAAGRSSFWRVVRLMLLVALIGLAGLLVLGVPIGLILLGVFAASGSEAVVIAVAIPLGIIALLVLIVAGLALQVVSQLATRELVLDGGRAVDSLKSGYTLARTNLKTAILVGLLALAIGLVAAIIFVVAALLVGLVLAIPAIIFAISDMGSAAIVAGVVAGVILLPLFLAAAGALGTFQHSYWTLAYLRLRPPAAPVPA